MQEELTAMGVAGKGQDTVKTASDKVPAGDGAQVSGSGEVEVSDDGVKVEVEWLAQDEGKPSQEADDKLSSLKNLIDRLFKDSDIDVPRRQSADDLLKSLLDVQEMYLAGNADYRRNLPELLAAAKAEAKNGNSRLCEVLGTTCLILDPESLGKSRSECVRDAINWYYKASCDTAYRRRAACGMQIARLSFKPKFMNLNWRQAAEWFEWAAVELKGSDAAMAAEAYMELGRIAECQGRYEDAAGWWKKADEVSGNSRGKSEQYRMQIVRGLDQFGGMDGLKALARSGEPYAAIAIVELTWTLQFPDELNETVPYDELPDMLGSFSESLPDAKAALASLKFGENGSEGYVENIEAEDYFIELTDAASHNSTLACYFLGKCYTGQLGHAIDTDMSSEDLAALAGKALHYFSAAAGEGFVPAIKDFVLVNSICYGFDADTSRYCDILDIFGESKYADGFRSDKDNIDADKLFSEA